MADVIVTSMVDTASPKSVSIVRDYVQRVNASALVIDGASPINVDKPELIKGRRCLVVEDFGAIL